MQVFRVVEYAENKGFVIPNIFYKQLTNDVV